MSMVFSLYNVATLGTALWTETQSVTVTDGVFSVNLGEVTPIPLSFDAQYYLGIAVGTDPEMTPRQALTSAGYAFRADVAGSAVDIPNSIVTEAKTGDSAVTTVKINDGAVTTAKINDGVVTDAKMTGVISASKIDTAIARDSELSSHTSRTDNPHLVTSAQAGSYTQAQVDALLAVLQTSLQTQLNNIMFRWGTAGLIETDNSGGAAFPQVSTDSSGNAVAVWKQADGTRDNIWANRLSN